ncbi:MAG: hypothetical protein U0905_01810 [Pirellulales bacterium]
MEEIHAESSDSKRRLAEFVRSLAIQRQIFEVAGKIFASPFEGTGELQKPTTNVSNAAKEKSVAREPSISVQVNDEINDPYYEKDLELQRDKFASELYDRQEIKNLSEIGRHIKELSRETKWPVYSGPGPVKKGINKYRMYIGGTPLPKGKAGKKPQKKAS